MGSCSSEERRQLEAALALVKRRLLLLDAVEERLNLLRELAERAADEALPSLERDRISLEVRRLEEEIRLLDGSITFV